MRGCSPASKPKRPPCNAPVRETSLFMEVEDNDAKDFSSPRGHPGSAHPRRPDPAGPSRPLRVHGSSTSAGATTRSSTPAGGDGSLYALTRQPWCFNTPSNGGEPVTLPVSVTADGSKP